jgi:hypothetical protein
MIQVNLLPNVKREYIQAQQMKHTFIVVSILAAVAAISLAVILFVYVQVVQPRHRANLQKDIDTALSEIKSRPDAVKIVTVQGALEQVPGLQDKKLITSNIFKYLGEFTPRDVSYGEVKLDLTTNTITLAGQTTTLERANVLANNLKSAQFSYKENDQNSTLKPFSGVVFGSLGKVEQATDNKGVSFQVTFQVDQKLFSQKISDTKITVNASSEDLLLADDKPFNTTIPGVMP